MARIDDIYSKDFQSYTNLDEYGNKTAESVGIGPETYNIRPNVSYEDGVQQMLQGTSLSNVFGNYGQLLLGGGPNQRELIKYLDSKYGEGWSEGIDQFATQRIGEITGDPSQGQFQNTAIRAPALLTSFLESKGINDPSVNQYVASQIPQTEKRVTANDEMNVKRGTDWLTPAMVLAGPLLAAIGGGAFSGAAAAGGEGAGLGAAVTGPAAGGYYAVPGVGSGLTPAGMAAAGLIAPSEIGSLSAGISAVGPSAAAGTLGPTTSQGLRSAGSFANVGNRIMNSADESLPPRPAGTTQVRPTASTPASAPAAVRQPLAAPVAQEVAPQVTPSLGSDVVSYTGGGTAPAEAPAAGTGGGQSSLSESVVKLAPSTVTRQPRKPLIRLSEGFSRGAR